MDLNELVTYSLSFDKLQGVLRGLAGAVAAQNDRIAELEAARDGSEGKSGEGAVEALEARVKALEAALAASEQQRKAKAQETDKRIEALERQVSEQSGANDAISQLKDRLQSVETDVAELKAQGGPGQGAEPGVAATGGSGDLAALQRVVQSVKGDVDALNRQGPWRPTAEKAAADAGALKARVEELEGKVAALSVLPAGSSGDVDAGVLEALRRHEGDISVLNGRVSDNGKALEGLREEVEALKATVADAAADASAAKHAADAAHAQAHTAVEDVAALRDVVSRLQMGGGGGGGGDDTSALWAAVRAAQEVGEAGLAEGRAASASHEVVNDEMASIRATLRSLAESLATVGGVDPGVVQRILNEAEEAARPASRGAIYDRAAGREAQHARQDASRSSTPASSTRGEGKEGESKDGGSTLDDAWLPGQGVAAGGLPQGHSPAPGVVHPVPTRHPDASAAGAGSRRGGGGGGGGGAAPTPGRDGVLPPSTGAATLPTMHAASTAVPVSTSGSSGTAATAPLRPSSVRPAGSVAGEGGVHLVPKESAALDVLPELHALQRLAKEIQTAVGTKANSSELRQLAAQVERLMAMLAAQGGGHSTAPSPDAQSAGRDLAGKVAALSEAQEDLAARLLAAEAAIADLQAALKNCVSTEQLAAAVSGLGGTPAAMGLTFGDGVTADQLDSKADQDEFLRLARTVHRLVMTVKGLRSQGGDAEVHDTAALVTKQILPGYKCLVCDAPLETLATRTTLPAIPSATPKPPPSAAGRVFGTPAGRGSRRTTASVPGSSSTRLGTPAVVGDTYASFAELSESAAEADRRHPAFPYNTPQAPHMTREHGRSPVAGEGAGGGGGSTGAPPRMGGGGGNTSTLLPNGQVLMRGSTPTATTR